MFSNEKTINKLFLYWLSFSLILVFSIIIVGGLTRLTNSGLSITEWELIKGILPPFNEKTWQVKRLEIKPNSSLSLQLHKHRAEHWVVVSGTAKVEINEDIFLLNVNESIYVPKGAKHRLSNSSEDLLVVIEIQSGSYLGEDDIIRLKDNYGRI